jgi:nitrile hydratase accessory protein
LPRRDQAVAPLRSDEGPLFAEPWQAEVLAIADALLRRGLFTAADWASALGAALAAADHHGAPDTPATYYRSALVALEQLLAQHAPEISCLMPDRISAWRRAHLDTPHGEPVVLAADRAPPISR